MTCKKDNLHQCKSSKKDFKSLEDIVADYIEKYREDAEAELCFYENLQLEEVVSLAAQAKGIWNGIHSHQKLVGASRLSEFASHLSGVLPELKQATSFEKIYDAVESEARKVFYEAELTVYDTALRIGATLRIEPKNVYLHRGAKDGAKNLGIALRGRRSISVDELPPAFRKLKPREIEDCLCIYKDAFQSVRRT